MSVAKRVPTELDRQVAEHDREIGALKGGMVALGERLDTVVDEFHGMRNEMRQGIRDLAIEYRQSRQTDEQARRPQYSVMVGLLGLVLSAAVAFATLTNFPQDNMLNKHDAAISALIAQQVEHIEIRSSENVRDAELKGRMTAGLDYVEGSLAKIEKRQEEIGTRQIEVVDRLSRLEGISQESLKQLDAVDKNGSRKWVAPKE